MSEIISNGVINLKKTRKSYTISEKLNALKVLKEFSGNIAKTSRQTNMDRKQIRELRNQENLLLNSSSIKQRRRLNGGGRKEFFPKLESDLIDWLRTERINNKNIVSYRRLREKAHNIAKELNISHFIGPNKWIRKENAHFWAI